MIRQAHNRLNLVGQRFTRLVVVEFAGIEDRRRESLWRCRCDCGNESIRRAGDLKSGNTKSCGCYHKDRTRQLFSSSIKDLTISRVTHDYRRSADKKGHSFNLTKEDMKQLLFAECFYCGAKPSNSYKTSTGRQLMSHQGIDRLDNSKGYTSDNVVPCCIVCNKMKKAMNESDFLNHIRLIAEKHNITTPQGVEPAEFVL